MFHISISPGRLPGTRELIWPLVLALGTFAVGVDAFAVAGLLPSMADALHVSTVAGGQSVTVFVLAYAVFAPLIVMTTAQVPRRVLLSGALLVLGLANLASALAPNLPALIAARVLAAGGAAAYTPVAASVCAVLVRPGRRAPALAVVVGGLVLAAGPAVALGGQAGRWLGWRGTLLTVAVMCAAAGVGVLLTVPSLPGRPRVPLGPPGELLRHLGLPVAMPLTVLAMAAGYALHVYRVPDLSAVGLPAIAVVLLLVLFGLAAALMTGLTGMRRATEERLRIARELHDSLTHSISMIKIQAGIAVHLARRRGEEVPPVLLAIQEASADAMRELRATLHDLRAPATELSTGGLDRLIRLVENARSAGTPTAVTIGGERRELPPDVDRAAYRIVQESLTNISRHAGFASALVQISYRPDAVTVRVDDDGRATPDAPPTPGIGLTGMRERVTALGGRLHAGPRPYGGFTVEAELPVRSRLPIGLAHSA